MGVFIYGVPGTGKTFYSRNLSQKTNTPLIEADIIKKKYGTCQAYQQFGPLNQENAIKGLLAVRSETRSKVRNLIPKNGDFIIEGAFLDPEDLLSDGEIVLLTVRDEARHQKQFYSHREKLLALNQNEFKAARIIQDYLIAEATRLGIKTIEC